MSPALASRSQGFLHQKQIHFLKALFDHAYETMSTEYPWYLLWNECFSVLNMIASDDHVRLATGPQQQFTKWSHQPLPPDQVITHLPNTRSNQATVLSPPLLFQDDDDSDCPMADLSFESSVTSEGSANDFSEVVEGYRVPDFTIFRYVFGNSKSPPLPSALVENKPLDIDRARGVLEQDTALLIMDRTTAQAREQLECLFREYPLGPGGPDPLPKVYHIIIAGGWYRIHEVTRNNWHQLPNKGGNPTYMFAGESVNPELLEFWPALRFQGFS
ncbi:hypothetical protein M413DRAFT_14791 [Hebeloma cylindrosporum]|uniref:Uncharacterized protein n=1 Tax=Hebeloma cylindrosporum TaxID=76867 RepID=A0A0C3BSH2_HEBCY|nr:hypothetical protein M413DRAFT_14791 [Hebeloma cylindrosporum h7]